MIKGIYASGSGMLPRMLRLEVIGNNLANINTTGFKRDNIFVQILKDSAVTQSQGTGELVGLDVHEYTEFTEGSLKQTNNQLDVAMQGRGFFVVETPRGVRYTRNGNFSLSVDGTVVTAQGYPVLGNGGRIQLPDIHKLAQGDLSITEIGEIIVDKKPVGTLRIADFEDNSVLKKEAGTYFVASAPEKGADVDGKDRLIRQGFLEESNVDGIEEMIAMVELSRNFESDQKAMQYQDGTLDKAMEVGRV